MESLIIREVRLEDSKAISKMRKMSGVIENIMASHQESVGTIRSKIMSKTENEYWFVAELSGRVVGMIALNKYDHHKRYHSGTITIMVNPEYHSMGIGKELMKKITNFSDELQIERLELTVFESNNKARELYKKFGFVEEGKKINSIITESGYETEILMARFK